MKTSQVKGKTLNQEKDLKFFRKSQRTNLVLIAIMPLFFLLQLKLQAWNITSNKMLFWGALANVFAILEHINYYYIQLMIDNKYDMDYLIKNKRFKKASLAKDLSENKI